MVESVEFQWIFPSLMGPFREAALLEPALKMLRARLAEDFKGAEGLKESDDGGLA